MDDKKRKIIIISAIVLAIIGVIIFITCNVGVEKLDGESSQNEIVPEEEISDIQLRETMISLYYINQNDEVTCEYRKIDSKELLDNPYMQVMNMLLEGPKNENLKTVIPNGVKVNSINKEGDCLKIDLSREFIDNQNDDVITHGLVIKQIVNTLTQFSEINKVKISVEGKNDVSFKGGNINFDQIFTMDI